MYKLSSITCFATKPTCPKKPEEKKALIQRQDTERKHGLRWCAYPEAISFDEEIFDGMEGCSGAAVSL